VCCLNTANEFCKRALALFDVDVDVDVLLLVVFMVAPFRVNAWVLRPFAVTRATAVIMKIVNVDVFFCVH
jgi:hypothetical protein